MTTNEITLNAWELNYASILAVQGESQGRTLIVTLIDKRGLTDDSFNAESIDRPIDLTGITARLYCEKPDGTKTFSDGTVTDATNGIVSFVLPYQATATSGTVNCQILLTKTDNSTLKTVGLVLDVQESSLEGAAESTSEYSALVTALDKADTAEAKAAQASSDATAAVTNANAAISSIEAENTSIQAAESARVTAENARVSNETARQSAETARQSAETSRASAETSRESNTSTAITNAGTATTAANTAADRANTAAANAEAAISGQLDPAIDARISAKTDVTGGIAGYDTHVLSTRTVNGHALSADVTVTKADVGLGNVDNTADASKSVNYATSAGSASSASYASSAGSASSATTAATAANTTSIAGALTLSTAAPTSVLASGQLWGVY